jgi:hypothetical protein
MDNSIMTLRLALITLILVFVLSNASDKIRIYVFYPLTTSPMIIQHKLSDISQMLKPTVFGRFQDFRDKTLSDRPEIIITKPQLLKEITGYDLKLNGIRNGSTTEPYVLLSFDNKISQDSLKFATIGVLDFMGRNNTEKFVSDLLGSPVHLNRATKIEDLLSMLTLNKARAVFINENIITYFKNASYSKIAITNMPNCNSGIICCAVQSQNPDNSIEECVHIVAKKTNSILEIDQWGTEK